jgi:hypothetical protein
MREIRKLTKGIRNRVLVSFLSVVIVLSLAGVMSLLELSRVSSDSGEILGTSERNLQLAKRMLDAASRQNRAIMHAVVFQERDIDSLLKACQTELNGGIAQLREDMKSSSKEADSLLVRAVAQLDTLTDEFMQRQQEARNEIVATTTIDSTATVVDFNEALWYEQHYSPAVDTLTNQIINNMLIAQKSLEPRTEQLKTHAYRAVTPVLGTLIVLIVIVLMLCYFIIVYGVRPVLAMNKSLSDFLRFGVPFKVPIEMIDEVAELKESIEDVVMLAKKSKSGQR